MKNTLNVKKLALASVIAAMILVIGFVPFLGYIRVGAVSITTVIIPVTIGSMALGWKYGAFFGFLFGVTSFVQCFTGDPLGAICVNENIFFAIVMCIVTRTLMGAITGLLAQQIAQLIKKSPLKQIAPSLVGPLLNTVFFCGALVLLYGKNTEVLNYFAEALQVETATIAIILGAMVTVNSVIEIIACGFIGTAVCVALEKAGLLKDKE